MSWIDDLIAAVQNAISGAIGSLSSTINTAISGIGTTIYGVQTNVATWLNGQTSYLSGLISGAANGISGSINSGLSGVSGTINGAISGVYGALNGATSAIQSQVNGVANSVTSSINNGLYNVSQTIGGVQNSVLSSVNSGINFLNSSINSATVGISSGLSSGLAQVSNTINSVVGGIGPAIQAGLNDLGSMLGPLIASMVKGFQASVDNIGQTWGSILTSLQQSLSQSIEAVGAVVTPLVQPLTGLISAIIDSNKANYQFAADHLNVDSIVDSAIKRIEDELQASRKEATDMLVKKLDILSNAASGKYGDFDKLLSDLSDPLPIVGALAAVVFMIVIAPAVGSIVSTAVGPFTIPVQQAIMERITPEVHTPEQLAQMVVQNVLDDPTAAAEAKKGGIDSPHFENLVKVAGEPPGMETLLDLWNREIITEADVDQGLKESRLKNKYNPFVKQLRYIIPPVSEIIQMAVKEAFNDVLSAQFQHDQDYPTEIDPWVSKLGLNPFWAKKYWRQHWNLPGVDQVLEMLHRKDETRITLDDVRQYLRMADISPFWRDKIIAIAYNVFTRVDIRRMYKVGVLDQAAVKSSYLRAGYNDKDAQALTDFTIHLEDETGMLNPDTEERAQWTALVALFVDDKRSESDLRTAAQKFGWGSTAIETEITTAKLRKEHLDKVDKPESVGQSKASLQKEIVNRIESLYATGHAELSDLSAAMSEYGWTDEQQTLELKNANLAKEQHYKPSATETVRNLTISTILDAMTAHLLTEDDAKSKLTALGLSDTSAALYISNKKYDTAKTIRTGILNAVKDSFVNGDITESDISSVLVPYGFSVEEINNYIALWDLEKVLRAKRFTEAQLNTFLKRGIISTDQYAEEMLKLGWSEDQVTWWTQLRGAS